MFHLGFVFFVTAGVFRVTTADDTVGDAHDHAEPQDGQAFDDQQETQEHPLESRIEADGIVQAEVWTEHIGEGVRRLGGDELARGAGVAAVGEVEGQLVIYRPAHDGVDKVTGQEPSGHEQPEADIAGSLILEILENFGSLGQNISRGFFRTDMFDVLHLPEAEHPQYP